MSPRRLEIRQGVLLALLLVGVPAGGGALLAARDLVGGRPLFPNLLAWWMVSFALWVVSRGVAAALGRTGGVAAAFEARGVTGDQKAVQAGRMVHLLALAAALLFLLTMADGGRLLRHRLTTLAIGFVPVVLAAQWRAWRLAAAGSGEDFSEASRRTSSLGTGPGFEALVTGTTLVLTPFIGSGVAIGGAWRSTRGWRRGAVALLPLGGFVVTVTTVSGLLRSEDASQPERIGLYALLALFSGSALVLARRALVGDDSGSRSPERTAPPRRRS